MVYGLKRSLWNTLVIYLVETAFLISKPHCKIWNLLEVNLPDFRLKSTGILYYVQGFFIEGDLGCKVPRLGSGIHGRAELVF